MPKFNAPTAIYGRQRSQRTANRRLQPALQQLSVSASDAN